MFTVSDIFRGLIFIKYVGEVLTWKHQLYSTTISTQPQARIDYRDIRRKRCDKLKLTIIKPAIQSQYAGIESGFGL